jgi:hypothetical protein
MSDLFTVEQRNRVHERRVEAELLEPARSDWAECA